MAAVVRLNPLGVAAVMRSLEAHALVNGAAERVANFAREQGYTVGPGVELPVITNPYTTDIAGCGVILAHPAGLAMQAKHGVLTKAAAAEGLEVSTAGGYEEDVAWSGEA